MILTNYKSICRIVHHNTLNTISIDWANRRLTNISVYLSIYQLDVHHIPNRLNFVPDVLSRLHALRNNITCKNNIESVLDIF